MSDRSVTHATFVDPIEIVVDTEFERRQ